MSKVRVLVVDDSVVMRRLLSEVISADPVLEVVATAATGSIALQKLGQLNPDVVVLDVDMPEMDGLETVKRIRATWPKLPVIMCSALTERGAETTFRALALGASDCIGKPAAGTDPTAFYIELRGKIRALMGRIASTMAPPAGSMMPPRLSIVPRLSVPPRFSIPPRATVSPPASRPVPTSIAPPRSARPQLVTAIAIGCSTGGPNALGSVFATLPKDLGVPIFITQHMPPLFTRLLAERLAASTGLSVVEAKHGDVVVPDRAYIAPGDFHLEVTQDLRIALTQDPPENSCRPAVDPMFRSVAQIYGSGLLALVMTGMGQDGTRGARAVVDAGGVVLVQDAATSVVPSMPSGVLNAGLADGVLPLDRIGLELVARVRRARRRAAFAEVRP